ncbi:MAG: DegT/DnrJ/EryC1/StrS family aminotransferase, partial [Syntrophorhabdales bacterium]
RMLSKHGGKDKYNVEHIGYNARLDTLQAAILLAKLKYVDDFNVRRRHVAEVYTEGLRGLGAVVPPDAGVGMEHVYHQYTVRITGGKRDRMKDHLASAGIGSMVYYQVPLHEMATFDGRCKVAGNLGETAAAAGEVLSLPMEPLLTEEEMAYTVSRIRDFHASGTVHAGMQTAL